MKTRLAFPIVVLLILAPGIHAQEQAGDRRTAVEDRAPIPSTVQLDRYDSLGGDFALLNLQGETVRLKDYRGRVVLVFFGYTNCPDACPLTVAKVKRAMRLLGTRREGVRFLFITTDLARDTPARLREWLGAFDPAFQGLRAGTNAELADVERRYGAFHIQLPSPDHRRNRYAINHTSRLYLIDRQGALRYLFTPDQPAGAIADGVRQLLIGPNWLERVQQLFGK